MSKVPMWQDPNESPLVRDLLQAGRSVRAQDYDVEAGLAKHMSLIDAGAPLPDWAQSLGSSSAASPGGVSGLLGTSGISGLTLTSIVVGVLGAATGAYMTWSVTPERSVPVPQAPVADVGTAVEAGRGAVKQDVEVAVGAKWQPVRPRGATGARAGRLAAQHMERTRSPESDDVHRGAGRGPAVGLQRSAGSSTQGANFGVNGGASPGSGLAGGGKSHSIAATSRTIAASKAASSTNERDSSRDRQRGVERREVVARAASTAQQGAQQTADQPSSTSPAPAQEIPVDDMRLEREMRMLKVAQDVLESDPARALRLAQAGEEEFPGSLFTQERQYLLIAALAKLGRIDAARKRATVYLKTYPRGPFSDQVRKALGSDD